MWCDIRVNNMRPATPGTRGSSRFADRPIGLRLQTIACPMILSTKCIDTNLVL